MNWYKLSQKKILVILRGISGSGKSTTSKNIPGIVPENIFSSDDLISTNDEEYIAFFEKMKEQDNWTPLVAVQKNNLKRAVDAMKEGRTPIAIDNLGIRPWNSKRYVEAALKYGYEIKIIDLGTGGKTPEELAARNRHGLTLEEIHRQIEKYEKEGPLTVEKILQSEIPDENKEANEVSN